MAVWLLILAAVFAFLAYDAWRLRVSTHDAPYSIEAEARGEPVAHVPLHEQARRRAWARHHGVGKPGGICWVWLTLAAGCLVGAFLGGGA
jgi:hypothetical protein